MVVGLISESMAGESDSDTVNWGFAHCGAKREVDDEGRLCFVGVTG